MNEPPTQPADPPSPVLTPSPAVTEPALPRPEGLPVLPGYEVLCELGRGGMGVVYQAQDVQLARPVAIKLIRAAAVEADELARFLAEARALAALRHPHIVSIHAVSEPGQQPFFAMEWLGGGSLAQRLDGTPWPARQAAELVETLARAIHFVHLRHIVHRDLKPANILLTEDGLPKIADFGVARRLDADSSLRPCGALVGTPSYMAPEQALGSLAGQVGPAADVYGLGAVLYELLTGRPPFRADTAVETVLLVLREEPVPPRRLNPQVPRDLEAVCLKCLQKKPGRRYATALELAEDLRNFQGGRPTGARGASWGERAMLWALRHPTRAAVYGLSALVLLLMGLAALGHETGRRQLDAGARHLEGRVQHNDLVMARLVANVVQMNLDERIDFLEAFRDEHAGALQAVRGGPQAGPELCELLRQLHTRGEPRKLFSRYVIADRDGLILASYPPAEPPEEGPPRRRAYRDWFHGGGERQDQAPGLTPVRMTHVSQPYVSGAADHRLSVAVAVPLLERGKGDEPAGVMTGRIVVRDLHSWLEGVGIEEGLVVLLDEGGHCLLHGEQGDADHTVDWRESCPLYREALSEAPGKGVDTYRDPIDGKEYLAGFARAREHGQNRTNARWLAIVQHDRAALLGPLDELRAERRGRFLLGLALGGGMTTGMWAWLVCTRRRQAA